jgi:hypothetical protein
LLAAPAYAGKNANGALIVHTNDANAYTANACSRFDTVDDPGTCENAGTQTNKPEDQKALVWLIANFCPQSFPGVSVIYFGLNHDLPPGEGYIANWGLCGPAGSFELPDAGWPDQGGNSVAFGTPVVGDTFFPFYYLAAYGFAGAHLGTGINPTGGYAAFVDDSNPPIQDDIYRFGRVRWGTPGSNDCLPCGSAGACCFPDGSCLLQTAGDCDAAGGEFQGDGTDCSQVNCPQLEACCFCPAGTCVMLPVEVCIEQGGDPMGQGVTCDPNPCACPAEGACCFPDGSCQVTSRQDCDAMGGVYYGDGVSCEQAECVPPSAACCVNGTCSVVVELECAAAGGVWFPDQPTCDPPFECPPVASRSTTWGRIKADYR